MPPARLLLQVSNQQEPKFLRSNTYINISLTIPPILSSSRLRYGAIIIMVSPLDFRKDPCLGWQRCLLQSNR